MKKPVAGFSNSNFDAEKFPAAISVFRAPVGQANKAMLSVTMMKISHLLDTARDLSGTTLALVAGIPPSTFLDALNDRRCLPFTPTRTTSQQEAHVLEIAEKCVAILDSIKPLSIPRGNWQSLRDLVETGKTPEQIRSVVNSLFEKSDTEGNEQ